MSVAALSAHQPFGFVPIFPTAPPSSNGRFKKIYDDCEHAWDYLGKIVPIVRACLNAAINSAQFVASASTKAVKNMRTAIPCLKLFSIISIPFTCVSLVKKVEAIIKDIWIRDIEGILLDGLSVTILAIDLFDTLTTFVNATLAAASIPFQILAEVAMPIAYILSGLGIVSRTIQIGKTAYLYYQLHTGLLSHGEWKSRAELKEFLENLLTEPAANDPTNKQECDEREAKIARKHASLLRSSSANVIAELSQMLETVQSNTVETLSPEEVALFSQKLQSIQWALWKKTAINLCSILANTVTISALILFSVGTQGSLPFVLVGTAFVIRLAIRVYEDVQTNYPYNQPQISK
jgi:hypothetical protein